MTADSATIKPKKSWLKMALFAFFCLTVALAISGWMLFGHYAEILFWNGEVSKALSIANYDSEQSKARVEQVFNDAVKAKVASDTLLRMYRTYAEYLYSQDEIARGDEQIDKAIAVVATEPATNLGVADQLCHAYQTRAWAHHHFWLDDPKMDNGAKDQEMAVQVAEKSFGPDHGQTIFKAPGLAVIYADCGEIAKADKLIDRCVKSVETKPTGKEAAWFVYACLARIRAVEHRYKDGLAAYFKNREISVSEDQSNRGWDEFTSGLRFKKPKKNPENALARKLLNNGNFAELDRIAAKLTKEKTEYWDGYWKLDFITTPLEWGQGVNEAHYNQLKLDLKTWLAKNPKSAVARSALANLNIYRAWATRDETDDGEKFKSLISEARATLAEMPDIKDKIPFAYIPLVRLTIPSNDKSQLLKLSEEGHNRWPTYFKLDDWSAKFLSTKWLGENGEQQAFIEKHADTMGGAQGDKFYARFAWNFFDNDERYKLFGKRKSMDWNRIKRGFKQIFKEFPEDVEARIAFMRLALVGKHEDDAKNMEW